MSSAEESTVWSDLNDDIWLTVIDQYLDLQSRVQTSRVCQRLYRLVRKYFDGKRALLLTDDSPLLVGASDLDLSRYHVLSVKALCEQRDGLWLRGERGLRLLPPIEIQELALRNYKGLTALCLVVANKFAADSSPIDLVLNCCGPQLRKLIVVNTSVSQFSISASQMRKLSDRCPELSHFELFTPYLYASEDSFELLFTQCPLITAFKLKVKHLFGARVMTGDNGGQHYVHDSHHFSGKAFTRLSPHISSFDCSSAILDHSNINRLLNQSLATNLTELGVDRVRPQLLQSITQCAPSLTSLSISLDFDLTRSETKQCMRAIGSMSGLQSLSFRWFGNNLIAIADRMPSIDDQVISGLRHCRRLNRVVIDDAFIDQISLQSVANSAPNIATLELIDCGLEENAFAELNRFVNLKHLFVSKSVLTDCPTRLHFSGDSLCRWNDIAVECRHWRLIEETDAQEDESESESESEEESDVQMRFIMEVHPSDDDHLWDINNELFFDNFEQ